MINRFHRVQGGDRIQRDIQLHIKNSSVKYFIL